MNIGMNYKLVCLDKQLAALKKDIVEEMDRMYPVGAAVKFWRTERQVNP